VEVNAVTSGNHLSDPVVLGIDFGGTKVAVAVCDLGGRCLATEVIATRPDDGAGTVLARGIRAARGVVEGLGENRTLVAAGVSTIGIPQERRVDLAPTIPGWDRIALGSTIGTAFAVPVHVATDVKAAAMAESRWGALVGCDPAIYLNLGTGLAAALVVGGNVVLGAHGASGEIGYNLTDVAQVGLEVDARQMLEDTVSGVGLAASGSRRLGRPATAVEVFDAAADDPLFEALLASFLDELSLHLVNLAIALDPARVAVGGGMVRSWGRLFGPLEQALKAGVPFPPDLVRAAWPFDAALIGALCIGIEAAGATLPHAIEWPGNAGPDGTRHSRTAPGKPAEALTEQQDLGHRTGAEGPG
jgi:glucokinase